MLVPRAGAWEFRGMRDVVMLCVTCGDVMSAETLTEPPRPDIKLQPLPFSRDDGGSSRGWSKQKSGSSDGCLASAPGHRGQGSLPCWV